MRIRPLKNRALQVKLVDTETPGNSQEATLEIPALDPQEINTILKDQIENLGKTILIVAAGVTALATAREVIVNNTNPAYRR